MPSWTSRMLGAQDKDVPGSEGEIRYEMRRLRAGLGIILLIGGLLQVAVVPGVGAQEKPLKPRLIEPALWSTPAVEMASDPWSMQTSPERCRSYLAMAGASTLGSIVGAGAGMLIGAGATDSLLGLIVGYPGAWLGGAVGADLTGAGGARAFFGSTIGLVAGAAVLVRVGRGRPESGVQAVAGRHR